MIRSPIALRLNLKPDSSPREAIRSAARWGARGLVLDAAGDFGPDRLGHTGRRDLRHLLTSVELTLAAMSLPTRRPFDTEDQLPERVARADGAFALAYELGARLVLVQVGAIPPREEPERAQVFRRAIGELGRRAEHRGVLLALEAGLDPSGVLHTFLEELGMPFVVASVDPATLLRRGIDPVRTVQELGSRVAHVYASDATGNVTVGAAGHPRGAGFPAGALDWEAYLGALEEVNYRGFVTIWPDPHGDERVEFLRIKQRLDAF